MFFLPRSLKEILHVADLGEYSIQRNFHTSVEEEKKTKKTREPWNLTILLDLECDDSQTNTRKTQTSLYRYV